MRYAILPVITLAWGCTQEFNPEALDSYEDVTEETTEDPVEEAQDTIGEGPEVVEDPGEVPCTVFYLDGDGDSYGGQDEVCLEVWEEGYVSNSDDCCDTNEHVHPGVTAYYEYTFSCDGADGGFDWDCNGIIERVFDMPDHSTVNCDSPGCSGSGWSPRYPECGESASYGTCRLEGAYCRLNPTWSGLMRCR